MAYTRGLLPEIAVMSAPDPQHLLEHSDLIADAAAVEAALDHVAAAIRADLAGQCPLVLPVMGGAVVFAGRLLPRLDFPLEFDYLHVTRYRGKTQGGEIEWRVMPGKSVAGKHVLVLDDILDEGATLAAIRDKLLELGAASVRTAVLTDKANGLDKPIRADYAGLAVPDRFVFGCGMDAYGWWRNLPEIRALRPDAA